MAGAESAQKAPDFILEGCDGDAGSHVWETNEFFTRLQAKTGVSFQFRQFADDEKWTERKKELLQKEDLPDVLFKASLTPAETRDLYAAGVLIDLAPYLEQYAPDLWALLEAHPDWKRAITLEDGAIPALPAFNTLQNNDAMWLNTSWLKRLGLEIPTTAEELTEVLRAFKTRDPNGNHAEDEIPLTFIGMWELKFLGHAFGIVDNDYYVSEREGIVSSSLTSDQNRAFLTWLHELWEEGLIDHNGFNTADSLRQITDEKKTIPYGMMLSTSPLTVVPSAALSQYEVLMPLAYEGRAEYRSLLGDEIRGTFAITSACQAPEKLVAWVNNFYTEEVSRLALYGQEGEEYIWNEQGFWEWNAPMEDVANQILPEKTISEGGVAPGIADEEFQLKYADDAARTVIEQMSALRAKSRFPYPLVTLSKEDEERVAALQLPLSRYAEAAMAAFVTGDTPLTDETWQAFVDTVNEKGLQELIAIWQKYVK
jgi:putative aldouronate transport system substrate-binding protein